MRNFYVAVAVPVTAIPAAAASSLGSVAASVPIGVTLYQLAKARDARAQQDDMPEPKRKRPTPTQSKRGKK